MKFPNASPIAPAWKSLTPWGMSKSRWPSYLVLDKNSFSYCSLRTDAVHAVHALIGTRDQPTREQGYGRSEEHTSELQSLMRISYAVFCLKKKKTQYKKPYIHKNNHTESNNDTLTIIYRI